MGRSDSDVFRVYGPDECGADGVPLDWELCRACEGVGLVDSYPGFGPIALAGSKPCPTCDGHGSLKAAALAVAAFPPMSGPRYDPAEHGFVPIELQPGDGPTIRCAGCGHPKSDGTWESPQGTPKSISSPTGTWGPPDRIQHAAYLASVEKWLRDGVDPDRLWAWIHWSPCDEGCRHEGPMRNRVTNAPTPTWAMIERGAPLIGPHYETEASWRQVDVRCMSWAHDLRPEKLSVLCLRCFADRRPIGIARHD